MMRSKVASLIDNELPLLDSNQRIMESKSIALPLGEGAKLLFALHNIVLYYIYGSHFENVYFPIKNKSLFR